MYSEPIRGRPAGTRPGPPVKSCPIASSSPRGGRVDAPVVHLRIHCSIMLYHVKGSVRLAGSRSSRSAGPAASPPRHHTTSVLEPRREDHNTSNWLQLYNPREISPLQRRLGSISPLCQCRSGCYSAPVSQCLPKVDWLLTFSSLERSACVCLQVQSRGGILGRAGSRRCVAGGGML